MRSCTAHDANESESVVIVNTHVRASCFRLVQVALKGGNILLVPLHASRNEGNLMCVLPYVLLAEAFQHLFCCVKFHSLYRFVCFSFAHCMCLPSRRRASFDVLQKVLIRTFSVTSRRLSSLGR